jgi:tRNA-specific 2-thiouridylase
MTLGADFIATGHYARRGVSMQNSRGETYAPLLRGVDNNKDQTYFLHAVHGREINKTLFPVGEIEKPEVRRIAEELDLATAKKKDSTGICFIGERRFTDFLKQYLPAQAGKIVLESGKEVGEHHGLMYYTLGQRGGIGIGGMKGVQEGAWFVLHKDIANNRLVIGQGHEHPLMQSTQLWSESIDWVAGEQDIPSTGFRCTAKTRYRQPDQACTIYRDEQTENGIRVEFDEPQRAVTPGQSVVFYSGEVCLGGGVIHHTNAPEPDFI